MGPTHNISSQVGFLLARTSSLPRRGLFRGSSCFGGRFSARVRAFYAGTAHFPAFRAGISVALSALLLSLGLDDAGGCGAPPGVESRRCCRARVLAAMAIAGGES